MNKPDFTQMTRKELKIYIKEHPTDDEAIRELFVNRRSPNAQTYPFPYDMEQEELKEIFHSTIKTSGDVMGNIIGHHNTMSGTVSKTIYNNTQDNIVEEIQQLIKELSEENPTTTTAQQMIVASQAIATIESRPGWRKKAINAVKQGTAEVLKTNPIGAFIVGAIAGWQE